MGPVHPILVTGAVGRVGGVGGAVVAALRRRDLPVRALVRRGDERADALRATGVELGLDLTSQPAYRARIRRWVAPPEGRSRDGTVTFVRRSCLSHNHPVGTCAMGSGREAVVDAELRVRGIEGLRIADASVMPTTPSAPTNAPTVMIGEFASRMLVAG